MTAIPTNRPAEPGRLQRWRLDEPLRFYLWPAVAALVIVLAVEAAGAGEWSWLLLSKAAAVGLILSAVGAARASVYSPGGIARLANDRQ